MGPTDMPNVDLTQAKMVRGASDEQTANQLIAEGWVLIDAASGNDENGYPFTRYALAWFAEVTERRETAPLAIGPHVDRATDPTTQEGGNPPPDSPPGPGPLGGWEGGHGNH